MCGIFGITTSSDSNYPRNFITSSFNMLAKSSEVRGKDSSGICLYDNKNKIIDIVKGPISISKLINNNKSKELILNSTLNPVDFKLLFGHARLVTNGSQLNEQNNQPVFKDDIIGVHNGIITNCESIWKQNPGIKKKYDIDTEILLSLIRQEIKTGNSIEEAISNAVNKLEGTISIAISFNDFKKIILATNNGSLYIVSNNKDILFFASEKHILDKLIKKNNLNKIDDIKLSKINPNTGLSIDLNDFSINEFGLLSKGEIFENQKFDKQYTVKINSISDYGIQKDVVIDLNKIHLQSNSYKEKQALIYPIDDIKKLKRCLKCILPETFPFIEFDSIGVCNYCKNHLIDKEKKSLDNLFRLVEPYRKKDTSPEVLVPISGGRDSCYVLHIAKDVLGLNVLTYTYDWGMVTDLARRNIARICGKLGVENIIVSADINWKRNNIKKNILAWLKYPSLGMIPLFMAGDKYFFYYAYKIKRQMNIDLEIWGVNKLENTNFKTGFSGLEPEFNKKHIYSLSLKNKLKLFYYIGQNVMKSPGYINQSVFDSIGSFASRYMIPKENYFHLFDYLDWKESELENTIINNYNWERAIDTNSTWRIGDGTASFYNYIYTLICGFSENDTFRSNQIRSGLISRKKALDLVYEENKPRYNSLKWYLEIIGLDFETVIKQINLMKRLY